MNVLLTGAISPLHWNMVARLVRDNHAVSLLGKNASPKPTHTEATFYNLSPNDPQADSILRRGNFGAIVFFFAYNSIAVQGCGEVHSKLIDALIRFYQYVLSNPSTRFILVTDGRIFGRSQAASETETPAPDTIEGILIKAAEDCIHVKEADLKKTLLLRVTNLYADPVKSDFIDAVQRHAVERRKLLLPGTQESPFDFLHVDDFASFLNIALDEGIGGTVHLAYGKSMSYAEVADRLCVNVPNLEVAYTMELTRTTVLAQGIAQMEYGWVPRHNWALASQETAVRRFKLQLRHLRKQWLEHTAIIRKHKSVLFFEVIALGALCFFLSDSAREFAMFRFIDFQLFYVILMAVTYGRRIGTFAALIACIGFGLEWVSAGNEAYLLLLNVDNWLAPAMYLLCGGIFGHRYEDFKTKLATLEKEREAESVRILAIEALFKRTYEERNTLQEQILHSRESHGRIYQVARELDKLQPEQVFHSTLRVLEDTLQCRSVALYACKTKNTFARLIACSSSISKQLGKSLDMKNYPLLTSSFERNEVFINTTLEEDYPAFAAQVLQAGKPVAMVLLWDVPYEQQALYYRNQFKILVGLVQSSMERALQHINTTADVYWENTTILREHAFRSALNAYQAMHKEKNTSFLLLRVAGGRVRAAESIATRFQQAARSIDICGRMDDGTYQALLPQAGPKDFSQIQARFMEAGLSVSIIE